METASEGVPVEPDSFREARWPGRTLFIGCLAILGLRGLNEILRGLPLAIPYWGTLLLGGLLPHLFLLLFPLLSPHTGRLGRVRPGLGRLMKEAGAAFLALAGSIVALAIATVILESYWPGVSMEARGLKDMAYSSRTTVTTLVLLFTFTVAPFSEEVFFRGFLYNGLRRRMPVIAAALVQAILFGAMHTFGMGHAFAAGFLGFVFALLYEWRKTLVAPILAHGGMNLLASIAVFSLMASAPDSPLLGINGPVEPRGCVVKVINPGSAAAQSNLQIGDVVAAIDETPTPDYPTLASAVRSHKVGETVTLTVHRGRDTLFLKAVLQRRGP